MTSTSRDDGGIGIQSHSSPEYERANGEGFLLIKDCNPWEGTGNVDALEEGGYTYDVIPSSEFADHDLGQYHTIIIPSTQTAGYYRNVAGSSDKLSEFVESGGTLLGHVADIGWPCSTSYSESFLPGGVTKRSQTFNEITIINSSPIFDGVSDEALDGWSASSHGYLTNLPDGVQVIAKRSNSERPTYVRYSHGSGVVLATMQILEWPWSPEGRTYVPDPDQAKILLKNELAFAAGDLAGPESVSVDVDVLSFIPGESENSTQGGDPFASAVSQFFPDDFHTEIPLNPSDVTNPLTLITGEAPLRLDVEGSALFDNWGTGDMVLSEEYPDDLAEALIDVPNKYEEDDGITGPRYRTRNGISVEFETTDDGSIDESTVSVEFVGENTESVAEQEAVNNLSDDVDTGGQNAVEGGYKPRHYSVETTTVDGTDAVQIATVFGGFTQIGAQGLELLAQQNTYDFFNDVLEWDFELETYLDVGISPDLVLSHASFLLDPVVMALAAVPNIYSYVELTVTAYGDRYVRMWDHSPFPEHAVYVDGDREHLADFPDEGGIRRLLNANFLAFLAKAGAGVTPYYAAHDQYMYFVREGVPDWVEDFALEIINPLPTIGPTDIFDIKDALGQDGEPRWIYANGGLSEAEIMSALGAPREPFDDEIEHRDSIAVTIEPF